MRIVIDTSVLVAATRSRNGASFALVNRIPSPEFQLCLSIALYSEWQDVLLRANQLPAGQTINSTLDFLRYLASQAFLAEIYFLWRPFLPDANDDMILEVAFSAHCQYIVTHNIRDFRGCERLGVYAITPGEFLKLIMKAAKP